MSFEDIGKHLAKYFPDRQSQQQAQELPNDNLVIHNMVQAEAAKGQMRVCGNYAPPARNGRPAPKLVGDDPAIIAKISHVLLPKERLTQFYARIGLSPVRIREMSHDEIRRFCDIVSRHERVAEPRPAPMRIVFNM